MIATTVFSLGFAGLTMASPVVTRQSAPIAQSKSFALILNVTTPGADFADHPINGLGVTTEHVGAGLDALVPNTATGSPYEFLYTVNDTVQNGVGSSAWEGMELEPASTDTPYVHSIVMQIEQPTVGFGVPTSSSSGQSCLALFAPLTGTFAVCNSGVNAPESPQYYVVFVEGDSTDWYATENVPNNCVAVKLLPQCVTDDTYENNAGVEEVLCYENVGAIDWSQQGVCS